ncbi:MAG: 4Fe-4S dicluster domain-containing protein [Methanocorpusculum sp.]|nr:4Fe-4S dicluster domain-containing protein [Methanocorpusculum sp.]MDE2522816.1 4Fe-4S dicluster domain-containing protein [Methanocorpusculum sp.]MDE2525292.1 4Fe-4S dicluster domain-containing protein [Methanocorpusculum sp.]
MKMLKIILKQFTHKPVTTTFPAEPARHFDATRGHVVLDPSKCTSCTICMKRCPSQAITVDRAAKTWTIDRFRCVICSQCVELCKFGAVSLATEYSTSATPGERGTETFSITYVKPEKPKKEPDSGN